MDTDSHLLSPMPRDPFQRMHTERLVYAYRAIQLDPADLVDGLSDHINAYVQDRPEDADLQRRCKDSGVLGLSAKVGGGFSVYYNNFEIVHIPSMRRTDVAEWFDSLESDLEHFYKRRWGEFLFLFFWRCEVLEVLKAAKRFGRFDGCSQGGPFGFGCYSCDSCFS